MDVVLVKEDVCHTENGRVVSSKLKGPRKKGEVFIRAKKEIFSYILFHPILNISLSV